METSLIMKERQNLFLSAHQCGFHSLQFWPFVMDHPPLIFKHLMQKLCLPVEEDICVVRAIFIHTFLDQGMCPAEPDQPGLIHSKTDGLFWGDAKLKKDDGVDMFAEATRGDLTGMIICQEIHDHLLDIFITEPGSCGPRATSHFFW